MVKPQKKPVFHLRHFYWKIEQNIWSPIDNILAPYGGAFSIAEAGYDEDNSDFFGVREDQDGVSITCYTRFNDDTEAKEDFEQDPELPAAAYPYLIRISIAGEWYNIFVVDFPSLISALAQLTPIATNSAAYERADERNNFDANVSSWQSDIEIDDETRAKIADLVEEQIFGRANSNTNLVDYIRQLAENGDLEEAITIINELPDETPAMIKIALRAIAHHAAAEYDTAIDIAIQAIQAFEESQEPGTQEKIASLLQILGQIYHSTEQLDQAQECIERANMTYRSILSEQPDNQEIRIHIAHTFVALGDIAIVMSKNSSREQEGWQRAEDAYEEIYKVLKRVYSPHAKMLRDAAAYGKTVIAILRQGGEYPE